ncbi:MAG: winged helix-turn-helix domain-containing protein [Xanthomonadales bacterium]|nr:winged helix-turn-helix domain-containing protein [Xanthomonadales bacterium]
MFESSSEVLRTPRERIGRWQIDAAANELTAGEDKRRLTPKAMQVLQLLMGSRGQVVTRGRLIDHAAVSDEGLSRIINEIREALGDEARNPTFIETIPRRGYRLRDEQVRPAAPRWRRAVLSVVALAALAWVVWMVLRPSQVATATLSQPTRLTAFSGAAVAPAIDGDHVWYVRRGPSREDPSLQRLNLETLEIEARSESAQALASLGDRLAWLDEYEGRCRLNAVAGGQSRNAECAAADGSLDWAPDGSAVAFELPGGALGLLSTAAGSVRHITQPPAGFLDLDPRFDGRGERLSFVRTDRVVGELHVMHLEDNAVDLITSDNQMVFDHAWVDHRHIVMSSDRSGMRRLWLLNIDDGNWQDLGHPGAMGLDYRAPDLVFEQPSFRADIELWDGRESRPVVASERYDNHPRLAPDGRTLAFVSTRSETGGIWVCGPEGEDPRRLQSLDSGRLTRPYWRDRDLMYIVFDRRGSHAWISDLDGNRREMIGPELAPREVAAAVDGRIYFLGSDEAGPALFEWVNAGGREEARVLVRGGFQRLEIDGDGGVYLSRTGGKQILRFDHSARLETVAKDSDALHWTVAGETLYFRSSDGLMRQNLRTGDRQAVSAPIPNTVGLGLSASPDGQRLYVARFRSVQVDLMHSRLALDSAGE